jgi:hypothetical protein
MEWLTVLGLALNHVGTIVLARGLPLTRGEAIRRGVASSPTATGEEVSRLAQAAITPEQHSGGIGRPSASSSTAGGDSSGVLISPHGDGGNRATASEGVQRITALGSSG